MLVRGGETLSLGGDVTVSVHSIPGHTAGSVAYVDRRAGRRVRRRRRAGPRCRQRVPRLRGPGRVPLEPAVPARRDPSPQHLYLGHPYRRADGEPYGVELDTRAGAGGPAGEPGRRGPRRRRGRRLPVPTACRRRTRRTPRSPASPRTSATRAIPRSSRPRSSPRCTATARSSTRRLEMRSYALMAEIRRCWKPAARRSPSARTSGSRCATASSSPRTPTTAPRTSRGPRSSR